MALHRKHIIFILFGSPDGWDGWWDWRDASSDEAGVGFERILNFARAAEAAKLDAFFKADFLGFHRDAIPGDPRLLFEPISVAGAIAARTTNIGVVATASTSFNEPYNVARQIASLDRISGGRAGWNAVTSFNGETNFGNGQLFDLTNRYERADEFLQVVLKLWDSWHEGSVIEDAQFGYEALNKELIEDNINFTGQYYAVEQSLDVARSPQGRPVIFQAGASPAGIEFAGKYGEAVFVATPDLARGQAFYRSLKDSVVKNGRHPDSLKILPGVRTYIADTETAARELYRLKFELSTYYTDRIAFVAKEAPLIDLSGIELDQVIPEDRIPERSVLEASLTRRISRAVLLHGLLTDRPGQTLREFLERIHGHGHLDIIGTPEQVAATFADWFEQRGSDGFTLHGGNSFALFTDEVLPLLRKRGIFREDYEGETLRDHLGIEDS